jgi:hypothetical protein
MPQVLRSHLYPAVAGTTFTVSPRLVAQPSLNKGNRQGNPVNRHPLVLAPLPLRCLQLLPATMHAVSKRRQTVSCFLAPDRAVDVTIRCPPGTLGHGCRKSEPGDLARAACIREPSAI